MTNEQDNEQDDEKYCNPAKAWRDLYILQLSTMLVSSGITFAINRNDWFLAIFATLPLLVCLKLIQGCINEIALIARLDQAKRMHKSLNERFWHKQHKQQ